MKILSKQKDYYDYLMGIMGIDELVVYDRRDAFPIDPSKQWGCETRRVAPSLCSDFQNINVERWFKKEIIYGDEKREEKTRWNSNKVLEYRKQKDETEGMSYFKKKKVRNVWDKVKEGKVYHFALDIGFYRYIFEVERYIDDEDDTKIHLDYDLVNVSRISSDERVHYAPIYLCPIRYSRFLSMDNDKFEITDSCKDEVIPNPILYSTYIPKFISPYDVWNQLYEYISSLNDKEIVDNRTNEEHIESHGFDKKISFRHRK